MADFTPYSTTSPWTQGLLPKWMSPEDAERIAAYQLYEEIYWGAPGAFELTQKGSDEDPIYVPAARTIIEATNRFLAVDWSYFVDPKLGTPEERTALDTAFLNLFRRETMWAKFATQKRYGLIRGDALWHITADETKAPGSRISIHELDPASYFPIYDDSNIDRIIGCHIVDVTEWDGKEMIRRQTYRKDFERGVITSEEAIYELAGWDDRYGAKPEDIKRVTVTIPLHDLPPQITQLPVYHIKNIRNPADPFGSSQLRGIERLAAAVNQTITDQDLAVALAGLGVYVTDSAAPRNEDGEEVNWIIGPGRVIELGAPGNKWDRVQGITTVQPSLDHAGYLEAKMREGAGVPAIATGDVDVQAAESGIALFLRLAPLLAANAEKETEMLGTYDQMFYDLSTMWFPAYEQMDFGAARVSAQVGDPMPENRQAKIDEVIKIYGAGIITLEMAQAELAKLGYEFPTDGAEAVLSQQARIASMVDPYANRVRVELEDQE